MSISKNRNNSMIELVGIQNLNHIAEEAPILIWMTDEKSRCSYINQGWLEFTGLSAEQILGLGWIRSIHKDELPKFLEIHRKAQKNYEDFEVECRLKRYDGKYKRMIMRGNCRWDEVGNFLGYVGICSDITKKQKQLETSENILKNIIESTDTPIVALDNEYKILANNKAHCRLIYQLFGVNIQIGDNILEKIKHLPEGYAIMSETWKKALSGEKMIKQEQFLDINQHTKYYEVTYSLLYNNLGKIIGATAISRDITETKEYEAQMRKMADQQEAMIENLARQNEELTLQEEQLRQSNLEEQKMHKLLEEEREQLTERNFELDQIIYKTSHDVRSPITSMMGLVEILKEEKDLSRIAEYVGFLEKRIYDLDRFTKSMLNYGKAQRAELERDKIEFATMFNSCFLELQYHPNYEKLHKKVEIKNPEIPFFTDAFRLKIILSNLISNAVKYQNLYHIHSFLKINVEIQATCANIILQDNGIGIPPQYLDKVFDMFFRATDKSEGSGLGMYIVKQTLKKLGGNVKIESEMGKGTNIFIHLPNLGGN